MSDRPIILFSAMSIDGFIAKADGNLDWLYEFDSDKIESDKLFKDFYQTIDTTIMGRKTYSKICDEGVPNPYPEKDNYVISKTPTIDSEYVHYRTDINQLIIDQKSKHGKPIWLVGGGILNSYFLKKDIIDFIILDIIPVVLGSGIKLFENEVFDIHYKMKMDKTEVYPSGRIHISYSLK
jgi:Dihydrofolate reductase